MNARKYFTLIIAACFLAVACNTTPEKKATAKDSIPVNHTYGYDKNFLKENIIGAFELVSEDSVSRVLLSADYQGRVITSTADGDSGTSFGWLNYSLIGGDQKKKQFNPFGGEERLWLGPEGGQYSIFFKGGDSFNINHWQVPALIDTVTFNLDQFSRSSATFTKKAQLTNYSGNVFNINIERTINLLNKKDVAGKLQTTIPPNIKMVGYETVNKLTNIGNTDWTKGKGLLSIWLLGMFTPSPKTVVIIPFTPVTNARSFITDNYFGSIPAERLQVKDSVLYFTCDGKFRSKIGLSPTIAKPIAAGFDFEKNVLTIVIPQVHKDAPYVNSKWELQKEPYKGDVINSYNDGPLADGTQMGPFFEIESSSPAMELKKGETGEYRQTTCHLTGDYNSLKQIAQQLLGVNLDDIKK
ncbi:hypothetical protein FRZ67_06665 [Panacibacter ginsenosidivorans]|uniref:Lipoprotein n=1 Tax=Panacibacter ginsenosidivorans TaxID=1813871 RepID=A0A5B8V6S1_9BACT|nr:DUF6786 family protein [Panacibacter ginsenosidivorans]QEC66992.1 hypothetical protein FRZ67_06665 [Panacibacter ginsenosidivorans]